MINKFDNINFYLETSMYTNYGEYKNYFKSLPDDLVELSNLIRHQVIHRTKLKRSYTGDRTRFDFDKS